MTVAPGDPLYPTSSVVVAASGTERDGWQFMVWRADGGICSALLFTGGSPEGFGCRAALATDGAVQVGGWGGAWVEGSADAEVDRVRVRYRGGPDAYARTLEVPSFEQRFFVVVPEQADEPVRLTAWDGDAVVHDERLSD
jgi:hypothetical protein